MSDSKDNSTPPIFQPLGTTASLRMAGSILNRTRGGVSGRRNTAGQAGELPVPKPGETTAGDHKHAVAQRAAGETLLEGTWLPAVARTAIRQTENREAVAPLWSNLPKTDLKPVVSAIETDLGDYLSAQRGQNNVSGSPEMALLAGQSDAASIRFLNRGVGSSSEVQQAAIDASTRMLNAVRAQAAAQAIAGENRISLGDLSLIAFADSKRQMAAATAHVEHTPDTHPLKKAIDNSANKKMMEDRKGFETKLKRVAELALESLEKSKRIAKERFGSHG